MPNLSRRGFIQGTGAGLVAATTLAHCGYADRLISELGEKNVPKTSIWLNVNGVHHDLEVEDRWTLAELVRDVLGKTGTKIGCDRGECGACTVLLDGAPVYSCSYLAVWSAGRSVQTVEALAEGDRLHPLQEAFIRNDGPQCGFCTSGQLMSAKALLERNPRPSPEGVRAALVGNICRCSNYNNYVKSVLAAATTLSESGQGA